MQLDILLLDVQDVNFMLSHFHLKFRGRFYIQTILRTCIPFWYACCLHNSSQFKPTVFKSLSSIWCSLYFV